MKKHINIPIFIPHYGCPNDCVFCNQKKITGKPSFKKEEVIREIEQTLSSIDRTNTHIEIAFFGGSFTAIPRNEMLELLSISDLYIKNGSVDSVRLSTRPDAISEEILEILQQHGVKTIELGIQSLSESVLEASRRGHNALHSLEACKLIKQFGFKLIGQMMIGLPCSSITDEINTAKGLCLSGCDGARIYPTVVFPETELEKMYSEGKYTKLSISEAVDRTANVLEVFIEANVPVIRIGLCANETLNDTEYAENYHPSIGELVQNRVFLNKIKAVCSEYDTLENKSITVTVAKGKISQAAGQKKINTKLIKEQFRLNNIKYSEDNNLLPYEISITVSDK